MSATYLTRLRLQRLLSPRWLQRHLCPGPEPRPSQCRRADEEDNLYLVGICEVRPATTCSTNAEREPFSAGHSGLEPWDTYLTNAVLNIATVLAMSLGRNSFSLVRNLATSRASQPSLFALPHKYSSLRASTSTAGGKIVEYVPAPVSQNIIPINKLQSVTRRRLVLPPRPVRSTGSSSAFPI